MGMDAGTRDDDRRGEETRDVSSTSSILYDPSNELVIQCDASSTGLGSTLMQKPLAYASHALFSTEVGYAQIEQECLPIVFSLERFHQYTFDRNNNCQHRLQTPGDDYKNPLWKASKRIKGRLLHRLQHDIVINYKKGQTNAHRRHTIKSIPRILSIITVRRFRRSMPSNICNINR